MPLRKFALNSQTLIFPTLSLISEEQIARRLGKEAPKGVSPEKLWKPDDVGEAS
jgi:hypothetical protein